MAENPFFREPETASERRMHYQGKKRVVIENVRPQVDCGAFPAKRALGETAEIKADILLDSHDALRAVLMYKKQGEENWREKEMALTVNDLWTASFQVDEMAVYVFTVKAWVDHYRSWLHGLQKKYTAGKDISTELKDGAKIIDRVAVVADKFNHDHVASLQAYAERMRNADELEGMDVAGSNALLALIDANPDPELISHYGQELNIEAQPARAAFSTWYELFPRSAGPEDRHGTFKDVEELLPRIADAGFDVLYLPPIHPIGETHRKGKNNSETAEEGDVGSPWAIGGFVDGAKGGHKAIHPSLGSMEDFESLVGTAADLGIAVALDIAFQCSPDHPYVEEHPEWFIHRADGSIRYAENPPKVYQDVYPFNFECDEWEELWNELLSVFLFWRERGVKVFRVDNPHTKPLEFWRWCLAEIVKEYPDTIFLSEAFTRPKVMYRLAKAGFTQSYTYFTWRNTKWELTQYMKELTEHAPRDFFRPNFWPNTPDILPEYLQYGGRPASVIRLVLAATLSSNYGMYGPAFEQVEVEAVPGKEEYLNSEKYEIKKREIDPPGTLWPLIKRINAIRRANPALQETFNVTFLQTDNEFVIFFAKEEPEGSENEGEVILVAVNLDPHHKQSAWLELPLEHFDIDERQSYMVHDLLGDDRFIWQGRRNLMDFDPQVLPARIFRLRKKLRRETDFDYFF
jgi:starch synthase (maltosyl-transferring)